MKIQLIRNIQHAGITFVRGEVIEINTKTANEFVKAKIAKKTKMTATRNADKEADVSLQGRKTELQAVKGGANLQDDKLLASHSQAPIANPEPDVEAMKADQKSIRDEKDVQEQSEPDNVGASVS